MIAKIMLGKTFAKCIGYNLEDKRELSDEKKKELTARDHLRHKNRAEVLAYNKCFGNKKELAEQFRDVRKLSKRVEKPVLHASLRLAPGESLNKDQWLSVAEQMAKELGVAENQYLVVQHHDTQGQHIHLVANRVGFDGKAASTSNNYYKMDKLCRRLEQEYNLQKVLSPRRFLPTEQRQLPRYDQRKAKMRSNIKTCLSQVNSLEDFMKSMQQLGYQVIKGRGISFVDDKKMRVKGSELGYSLARIEKELLLKQANNISQKTGNRQIATQQSEALKIPLRSVAQSLKTPPAQETTISKVATEVAGAAAEVVAELFKAPYQNPADHAISEIEREYYRNIKKKKKRGYRR